MPRIAAKAAKMHLRSHFTRMLKVECSLMVAEDNDFMLAVAHRNRLTALILSRKNQRR